MSDTEHRGRGRPPTGTRIEANVPADVLAVIDREAAELGRTRAAMIRDILEQYASDVERHA